MKYLLRLAIIGLLLTTVATPQWSRVGFPDKWINALFVKDGDIIAAYHDNIYRSNDDGLSWDTLAVLGTIEISAFEAINDTIFAVSSWLCAGFCPPGPCIFRSTDNGATWDSVFSAYYGATVIETNNGYLFSNPHAQLFRSDDMGISWTRVLSDSMISGVVLALVATGEILYAAGSEGEVYRTTDNAATWTSVSTGLPKNEIYQLVVKDSLLFAGTGGDGIYRSLDGGRSWTSVNNGLPGNAIVGYLALNDNGLFAAIGENIYLTTDSGSNWINVSEGFVLEGYGFVASLVISGDYLFAGTNDGIWRRLYTEMLSADNVHGKNLPKNALLEQNYPNPFNPSTAIRFDVPHVTNLSLIVYDILGHEIIQLVDQDMEPGYYQVVWDSKNSAGRELPSGIYIARLTTPKYTRSIKMVLLR